jgi:nucleoside-diphosphate-sugar epimerase
MKALIHLDPAGQGPSRAVVVGAGGFVGAATAIAIERRGIETLRLGRADVDLLSLDAARRLKTLLKPTDAVVVVAAKAPCRTYAGLRDNVAMMAAILDALTKLKPAHIVYVSSDAVYGDQNQPLNENAVTAPQTLHGVMHLARETMLRAGLPETPLAILRPTLVYGASDPHNGYGPNRFRRLAQSGQPIVLFGAGEERRDHVAVEDVAELAARMVMHRSTGTLNAATGKVMSFMRIAELIAGLAPKPVAITGVKRDGPIPHNGFRPFDASAVVKAFPDFRFTPPEEGIKRMYQETEERVDG